MSFKTLTTALTLYHSGTLTLEQAAAQGGVTMAELATELRSRGIPVRDADRQTLNEQTAN